MKEEIGNSRVSEFKDQKENPHIRLNLKILNWFNPEDKEEFKKIERERKLFRYDGTIKVGEIIIWSLSDVPDEILEGAIDLSSKCSSLALEKDKAEALRNFAKKYKESENADKDIRLYINSPGGSVTAGMAIYDTIQYIKCDVSTICVGLAASMGATLLSAGAKGKRFILPNSEILIHQVMGGVEGQAIDIKIKAEHILKIKDRLNKILSKHTGQPLEKIEQDTDRDYYMTAEEAKAYGIVDKIIQ